MYKYVNRGAKMLLAFFESLMYILTLLFLLEFLLRMVSSKNQDSNLDQAMTELENAVVLCRVEQIKDVFYFYNSQDEQFVGQATSMNEIVDLSERLQKHIIIVDGDEDVLEHLKKVTGEEWKIS